MCLFATCSQKASQGQSTQPAQTSNSPEINSTMVYEGAGDGIDASSSSTCIHLFSSLAIAGAVSVTMSVLLF